MRLLSIDDEKTSLLLVESMAEQIGFEVSSFLRPTEALHEAETREFDMILVDYMMPELNGIDFIRSARIHQPDIPIVMITGTIEDRNLKIEALEAGVTEFLNKPIDVAEFRARLMNLAELRQSQLLLKDRALLLEAEVAKATRQIADREYETLNTLGRAAEYRDPETGAHIARVAHYSRLIAEEHGLPADTCNTIFYAAPLHDIGKIGISDSILLKPARLSSQEFEEIKRHASIGHGIIRESGSAFLAAGAQVALNHHERFDGKGYPGRKIGSDIHLFGRIVAIADVFDALTSERPYKKPWPFERTFEHIDTESGAHFDPELAGHFVSNEKQIREIFERFREPTG